MFFKSSKTTQEDYDRIRFHVEQVAMRILSKIMEKQDKIVKGQEYIHFLYKKKILHKEHYDMMGRFYTKADRKLNLVRDRLTELCYNKREFTYAEILRWSSFIHHWSGTWQMSWVYERELENIVNKHLNKANLPKMALLKEFIK